MSRTRRYAWGNRIVSATTVAVVLLAARHAWPEPGRRVEMLYPLVLGLGYGHLLGAALRARHPVRAWLPEAASGALVAATVVTTLLSTFAVYRLLLAVAPGIVFPLLAIATWHVFENDGSLESSYRRGRPAPVARSGERHALALGWTILTLLGFLATIPAEARVPSIPIARSTARTLLRAGALAVGFALVASPAPRRRLSGGILAAATLMAPADASRWLPFGDLFAAVTLYHLLSWGLLMARRMRPLALVALHAPGLLAAAGVLVLPAAIGEALAWLFWVELYLFWSMLHVVQTLVRRGIARPSPIAAASARCADG